MNTILAVARPVEHRLLMIGGLVLIVTGLLLADEGLTWQTMVVAVLVGSGIAAGMVWMYLLRVPTGREDG